MHWILQDFDDMRALAKVLDRLGLPYSWHKVVPFEGRLDPVWSGSGKVILFGSYALWRTAEAQGLDPGVLRLRPFVDEAPWADHLLNGPGALRLRLEQIAARLPAGDTVWFSRPVEDSKAVSGGLRSARTLHEMAAKVMALDPAEIAPGSLRPDTELLLSPAVPILKEWRLWVVAGQVVTGSLYKEGARVTWRAEVDADTLAFAQDLVARNPGYAPAYVMDLCRTPNGLRLLETNCLNAAGFYAADLARLVTALEAAFG